MTSPRRRKGGADEARAVDRVGNSSRVVRRDELVFFHVIPAVRKLDPEELAPTLGEPALFVDMETEEALEVSPDYARNEYRARIAGHLRDLSSKAQAAGIDYFFLRTDRPLDEGLREYLAVRQRRK